MMNDVSYQLFCMWVCTAKLLYEPIGNSLTSLQDGVFYVKSQFIKHLLSVIVYVSIQIVTENGIIISVKTTWLMRHETQDVMSNLPCRVSLIKWQQVRGCSRMWQKKMQPAKTAGLVTLSLTLVFSGIWRIANLLGLQPVAQSAVVDVVDSGEKQKRDGLVSLGLWEATSKNERMAEKGEKGGVLVPYDENISLSGAKTSTQHCLFYHPSHTHTQKRSDPTTLAKKSQALGKIGRLLCNQHVYNQVSDLFFLFTCTTWGHLPSVLWLSHVSMGRLSTETVLSFFLAKFLWRNNGSWIKSFLEWPQEICPK